MGTPEMILRIVLTVVSTFFMSMDFEKIVCLIKRLLPERYHGAIGHAKEKAVTSIVIFIRAYTVIFLLTFAELGIGFWLLKIPYAGGLGFLVADCGNHHIERYHSYGQKHISHHACHQRPRQQHKSGAKYRHNIHNRNQKSQPSGRSFDATFAPRKSE